MTEKSSAEDEDFEFPDLQGLWIRTRNCKALCLQLSPTLKNFKARYLSDYYLTYMVYV